MSKQTFTTLDYHLWQRLWWWARRSHPKKPRRWVAARHFGKFHPARNDRWVFGDAASGAFLHRFAWTKIERHVLVKGAASPDDPALTQYWADRRRKTRPPLSEGTRHLLKYQRGRCPACGGYLLHAGTGPDSPSQWEQWFHAIRAAITRQVITSQAHGHARDQTRLIHAHCARRHPAVPHPAHDTSAGTHAP